MPVKIIISSLVFAAAGIFAYYWEVIRRGVSEKAAGYGNNIRSMVSRSMADIKGSEIVQLEIAAGAIALALVLLTSELIIIVPAVAGMIYLPKAYIKIKQQRYIRDYYAGLTGFLESVVSNLKAGLSIVKAFQVFSARGSGPVPAEMGIVLKKVELGKSLQEALQDLAVKIPLKENEIIISAINTALETGGNINEVLENILLTIRKRDELEREVKALTSQGVLSGIIVGLLPVFLILAVSLIDPGFMEPMFSTTMGKAMLGVAFVMEITGAFFINKIIRVR